MPRSINLSISHPEFAWTGAIFGGIMFGIGMALVGTCGFGAVVRLGGGSLRALVVLTVIGLDGACDATRPARPGPDPGGGQSRA
jgi:uncharacterized membrane protein YedE/YeeE